LRPGTHEGYVAWERAEAIRQMIIDNSQGREHRGAVKHGDALLAGILRCRRCGRKLTVRYTGGRHDILRYSCSRGWMDNGEPRCIAFGGLRVDDAIAAEVLRVVQPATIEAAVQAQQQEVEHRDDVRAALTRDFEAARFAADRAFRQYDATDPQNRLVAAELELRWNRALERVTELQERIDAHDRQRPAPTSATPDDFASLAGDLKTVWADPATDVRLKKRIVRTLIHEVIADIEPEAGEIVLVLHWAGGVHTELRLPRRRRGQRNSTAVEIIGAVRVLVRIAGDDLIAGLLNRNGLTTGHGNRWTRERVTSLRSHYKIPVYSQQARESEGWMTLTQAAATLAVSAKTLRLAAERGEVQAQHPLADGPWIFKRTALETETARRLAQGIRNAPAGHNSQQQNLNLSMT
jgi:hypothetical protein